MFQSRVSTLAGLFTALALGPLLGCTTLLGDFEAGPDRSDPDASLLDGGSAADDPDGSRELDAGHPDGHAGDDGPSDGHDADAALPDADAALPDACVAESDAVLCARHGTTCGGVIATDACGQSRAIVSCGECTLPATCGAEMPNACGCKAEAPSDMCKRLGKNCGSVTAADACGTTRTVTCGACTGTQTCGPQVANVCGSPVCAPEADADFCKRYGKNCGALNDTDNCGKSRAAACGSCVSPQTCGAVTANVCGCVAESDASYCARLGHTCGSLSGADRCGVTHAVTSCGSCTAPNVCSAGGTCACVSETDAQFCSRLGYKCGKLSGTDSCGVARTVQSCGAVCSNQACVTGVCSGVCAPGTKRCSGNGLQTCDASGQWGAAAPCAATCVSGACRSVTSLAAQGDHTCAVVSGEGAVYCWGNGQYGELGNGSGGTSAVPVAVKGLVGASRIANGANHTCALAGTAMSCWGRNDSGQLGNSTKVNSSVPSSVSLSDVTSFGVGPYHTCSVGSSGAVTCWGSGSLGKLGNGTTTDSEFPYAVSGLGSGALAVTAGTSHTCALVAGGRAVCWGDDSSNELGDGGGSAKATPVSVSGLSGATSLSAGGSKTCALLADGTVQCWGLNAYGEMGNGTSSPPSSGVVKIPGLSGVTAISSGDGYACALLSNGTVSCWGANGKGELGLGTASGALSPPTSVPNLSGVIAIAAGSQHTCALLSGGNVKCWGWNYYGQLGTGATTDSGTPVDVKW